MAMSHMKAQDGTGFRRERAKRGRMTRGTKAVARRKRGQAVRFASNASLISLKTEIKE
jgi:hypothetical protein